LLAGVDRVADQADRCDGRWLGGLGAVVRKSSVTNKIITTADGRDNT
jgi:hypothetical protein